MYLNQINYDIIEIIFKILEKQIEHIALMLIIL